MITKPDDAVPRYVGGIVTRGSEWFTAKETAEIACAYAESVGKYINAISSDMEREASDEMDKWQDRFIEWGWMK